MSNNRNIELVKQLLQKAGVVIHPKSEGVMVYAYRNGKQYETFVCRVGGYA